MQLMLLRCLKLFLKIVLPDFQRASTTFGSVSRLKAARSVGDQQHLLIAGLVLFKDSKPQLSVLKGVA